ncbi:hypothetical protein [Cupriavidus sp. YAF13]|uniref:hypothetical protein n=1 Tax=Cupriavidus sp. YAF13 TaxID=3233075 RepID=UPI003F91A77F
MDTPNAGAIGRQSVRIPDRNAGSGITLYAGFLCHATSTPLDPPIGMRPNGAFTRQCDDAIEPRPERFLKGHHPACMEAAIPVLPRKMYRQCDKKACQSAPGFPVAAPEPDKRIGRKLSNIHFLAQARMHPRLDSILTLMPGIQAPSIIQKQEMAIR